MIAEVGVGTHENQESPQTILVQPKSQFAEHMNIMQFTSNHTLRQSDNSPVGQHMASKASLESGVRHNMHLTSVQLVHQLNQESRKTIKSIDTPDESKQVQAPSHIQDKDIILRNSKGHELASITAERSMDRAQILQNLEQHADRTFRMPAMSMPRSPVV